MFLVKHCKLSVKFYKIKKKLKFFIVVENNKRIAFKNKILSHLFFDVDKRSFSDTGIEFTYI